jgi:replication-associated recombination protein RarA
MNGLIPNCFDDFLISNSEDHQKLEYILSRKLPFPFGGKSGVLLHGTWGTGKSTLAALLPKLIETAYSGTWDTNQGVGQMPSPDPDHVLNMVFRCGGGLSSTEFTNTINKRNMLNPIWHNSQHYYYVFDEVDRLSAGAQQSLRSTMDLPRSMFFFTTNHLNKIDRGIVNRCHLVEMNQMVNQSAYVPLGLTVLQKMGIPEVTIDNANLLNFATSARGSIRTYIQSVVWHGIALGGVMPK